MAHPDVSAKIIKELEGMPIEADSTNEATIKADYMFSFIPPEPNLYLGLGEAHDGIYPLMFEINQKKTLVNQFKYWMLTKFFPFKIEKWDKEK